MPKEPKSKRVIAFIDGQNLYYGAKDAFGYTYPNFDARALVHKLCEAQGWKLIETRFYTGVPSAADNPTWNTFWTRKLAAMGKRKDVWVFSRPLRYRSRTVAAKGGKGVTTVEVGEEKGIDVRIALDIIRYGRQKSYDVALIVSQDQDLSEAADEIRMIAQEQNRWIKAVSAFARSARRKNTRGINKTDWIEITKKIYDACIDKTDYRDAALLKPRKKR